jgi:sortase A
MSWATTVPVKRTTVLSALVVVIGAVLVLGAVDRPAETSADAEPAGASAVSARATASTTTTTAPPPLPVPEALPTNAHEATPQIEIGRLEIPALGVDEPLQEGMTLTAINRGPSHWPGTALPGQIGNVVVAGHRTTYSQPFNRLDELVGGELVHFRMADGITYSYSVRGVIIVPEAMIGIATQHRSHGATLFACHPKGSATHRVVAKLALLGPDGLPVDPEAAMAPIDVGLRPGDEGLLVRDPAGPAPVSDPYATGA